MTNQQTPAPITRDEKLEGAVEDICQFAAKLKRRKENDDQIQKRLTDAGLSLEAARAVTQIGLARLGRDRSAGLRNLLIGVIAIVIGMVIRAFASAGGVSWIAYGVILLGVVQMLFGLLLFLRTPRGNAEVRNIVERVTPTIKAEETSRWKIAAIKIHNP